MLDARGVMEPWQEPRSGRGWFVLLLGIVVFAAFGGVVGYAYFRGLPGIGGEPPLIRAEPGPYRVAPEDPGGLAISNARSRIVAVLGDQPDETRIERILPAEAAPALEATEPEPAVPLPDNGADQLGRLAAPEPTATAPSPGDLGSIAPGVLPAADALGVPYPISKPVLPEPGLEPQAGPAETQISALAAEEPPPVAPEPAPAAPDAAASPVTELPAEVQNQPPVTEPTEPAPVEPPRATPRQLVRVEPAAAPVVPRAVAGGGIYRLQLAAVRSEGGLTQAWAELRQRYPAALRTVTPNVERTDTTSGPLYRLQAGPFSNREDAANACGAIRASGGQCFIVGPIAQ